MNKVLILDGKKTAQTIRTELKDEVRKLQSKGINPKLAIILIGNHPPSLIYVANKQKSCRKIGISVETFHLPEQTDQQSVVEVINRLNADRNVHGIILQLPLPGHLNKDALLELIAPDKDVDGLTPTNLGRLLIGRPLFIPATPAGIIELLSRYLIPISGRRVVIVGRGELVGKPLASLLLLQGTRGDATITVCHSKTKDLSSICNTAEILIVAVGKPGLITGDMVKENAVVVDAGINRTDKGICGDVDFETVGEKAAAITPVPGGVGPMTVAMLLMNTILATQRTIGEK